MKKRTAIILKCIASLIIVLGVLYAVLLGLSYRSLRKAYAALEADGRPMTAEQIIPAEIPDADNAALIYEAVVLQLKAEPAGEQNLFERLAALARGVGEDGPDSPAAESFRQLIGTEPVVKALAALEKANAKSGCRYDNDYSKGAEMAIPHVGDLMNLSKILCATARMQAAGEHPGVAWDTLITGLHFADALRDEPFLISQLVRIAKFAQVVDAIQAIAPAGRPSAAQAEELAKRLEGSEDMAPYVRALDGERILLGEWAFKYIGQIDDSLAKPLILYSFVTPLMLHDHATYLAIMNDNTKNAQSPYAATDTDLDDQLEDRVKYCLLTSMLVPAVSAAKGKYTSMVAKARVTRAGLAALQYHETRGRFPADLESLGLPGLVDPFGGQPLVYRTVPAGFLVYSLGENMQDDGGISAGEKEKEGDLVWQYTPIAFP